MGLSVQKMDSNAMEEDCMVRREKNWAVQFKEANILQTNEIAEDIFCNEKLPKRKSTWFNII